MAAVGGFAKVKPPLSAASRSISENPGPVSLESEESEPEASSSPEVAAARPAAAAALIDLSSPNQYKCRTIKGQMNSRRILGLFTGGEIRRSGAVSVETFRDLARSWAAGWNVESLDNILLQFTLARWRAPCHVSIALEATIDVLLQKLVQNLAACGIAEISLRILTTCESMPFLVWGTLLRGRVTIPPRLVGAACTSEGTETRRLARSNEKERPSCIVA